MIQDILDKIKEAKEENFDSVISYYLDQSTILYLRSLGYKVDIDTDEQTRYFVISW